MSEKEKQLDQQNRQSSDEASKKLLAFEGEDKKKQLLSTKVKKELREWIVSFVVALVLVIIIRSYLFTIIRVDGPSMSDTLLDGDGLFVNVLDMKLNSPERFDVVICRYPNRDDQYVKRVIGLPGDTLSVRGGVLYINDQPIEEPFLSDSRTVRFDKASNSFGPVKIPEGCYYVMGDNRDDSNDSRNVGMITEDMVIGKVEYIIWPFNRISSVAGSEEYAQ